MSGWIYIHGAAGSLKLEDVSIRVMYIVFWDPLCIQWYSDLFESVERG